MPSLVRNSFATLYCSVGMVVISTVFYIVIDNGAVVRSGDCATSRDETVDVRRVPQADPVHEFRH